MVVSEADNDVLEGETEFTDLLERVGDICNLEQFGTSDKSLSGKNI